MTSSILIIEDNDSTMKLATFILEAAGHTVLAARDAETGFLSPAAADPGTLRPVCET